MATFICRKCQIEKPTSEFTPNRWTPVGHTLKCKACCTAYAREFRARNPTKVKAWERAKWEKWRAQTPYKRQPRVTVDGRLCSGCRTRKPDDAFGRLSSSPDGLNFRCKECTRSASTQSRYGNLELARAKDRAKANKRYAQNREKMKTKRHEEKLKYKYGLSRQTLKEFLDAQDSLCAICAKIICLPTGKQTPDRANVDHDHATGAVRGLLCTPCNTGLGAFSDDQGKLGAAIEYLRQHAEAIAA